MTVISLTHYAFNAAHALFAVNHGNGENVKRAKISGRILSNALLGSIGVFETVTLYVGKMIHPSFNLPNGENANAIIANSFLKADIATRNAFRAIIGLAPGNQGFIFDHNIVLPPQIALES